MHRRASVGGALVEDDLVVGAAGDLKAVNSQEKGSDKVEEKAVEGQRKGSGRVMGRLLEGQGKARQWNGKAVRMARNGCVAPPTPAAARRCKARGQCALMAARKSSVLAVKAVGTQGKGSALATKGRWQNTSKGSVFVTKAMETRSKGGVFAARGARKQKTKRQTRCDMRRRCSVLFRTGDGGKWDGGAEIPKLNDAIQRAGCQPVLAARAPEQQRHRLYCVFSLPSR